MSWGRWILGGWIVLLIIVLGVGIGLWGYTRLVVDIRLQDQPAVLRLPPQLVVSTQAAEKADIGLQGNIKVAVPFKNPALPLRLKGAYRADLSLDTKVPLKMTIHYHGSIPVTTTVSFDSNTGIVYKWLPHFPLKGKIPVKIQIPVDLAVPVDTHIRFQYDGPVVVGFNQLVHAPVDTVLNTVLHLDKEVEAPITNTFRARLIPDNRDLPIILNDTTLKLPLRDLKLSTHPSD